MAQIRKGRGFKARKISIIIPVYNSHKAVSRQLRYFKSLDLPDSIEIILMDDGSDPPLKFYTAGVRNCNIYPTGDTRPWSQPCAKNLGVKIAEGEYIFITDIDHILTREAIAAVENFDGDKMIFPRSFAVLNNRGKIVKNPKMLFKYGYAPSRYKRRGRRTYYHVNTFAMKKRIFKEIGGYPPEICDMGVHETGDDKIIDGRYRKHCKAGHCNPPVWGPEIHVFPGSVRDPRGLFHHMDRKGR